MPRVGVGFFRVAANLAWQTVPIVVSGLVIGELGYFTPAETLRVILRLTALSRVGMSEGTRFARAALATMVILPAVGASDEGTDHPRDPVACCTGLLPCWFFCCAP